MQKPQASSSSRRSLSHIWSWGLAEGLGWSQQGWRGHPPLAARCCPLEGCKQERLGGAPACRESSRLGVAWSSGRSRAPVWEVGR